MNEGALRAPLRRGAVVLVAIAACLGIAACGSSSPSGSSGSGSSATASTSTTSTAAGNFSARRAALASCLKAHGVTLPNNGRFRPGGGPPPAGGTGTTPIPGRGLFGGGGAGGGAGGPGRFLNNPKMRAAFQACAGQSGGRFGGGVRRAQLSHTAITNFVACVRKNGFNMPAPNFSGKGPVFPANIRTNAKFVTAAKACASILVPARPPGGTTTT